MNGRDENPAVNSNNRQLIDLDEREKAQRQEQPENGLGREHLLPLEDDQLHDEEKVANNDEQQLQSMEIRIRRSLVNPRMYVTDEEWVVSLLNTDGILAGLKGAGHVKMLIEGLEKSDNSLFFNFYFRACDIVSLSVEEDNDNSLINTKGRIGNIRCFETIQKGIDYTTYPSRSYVVTPLGAKAIVASVQKDRAICQAAQAGRGEYPLYQYVGTHHFLSDLGMGHNCASWCVEKLTLAGIDLTRLQSKPKKITSLCVIY